MGCGRTGREVCGRRWHRSWFGHLGVIIASIDFVDATRVPAGAATTSGGVSLRRHRPWVLETTGRVPHADCLGGPCQRGEQPAPNDPDLRPRAAERRRRRSLDCGQSSIGVLGIRSLRLSHFLQASKLTVIKPRMALACLARTCDNPAAARATCKSTGSRSSDRLVPVRHSVNLHRPRSRDDRYQISYLLWSSSRQPSSREPAASGRGVAPRSASSKQ